MSFSDNFTIVFSFIWTWIKPVLLVLITQVSKDVFKVAYDVVKAMSETDLTNKEKRDNAFEQISYYLTNEGKNITSSIINLVIELAVQKLKDQQRLDAASK